jgi:hypothetical protein
MRIETSSDALQMHRAKPNAGLAEFLFGGGHFLV